MQERTNEEWLAQLRPPTSEIALADLRTSLINGLTAALSGRIDRDLAPAVEDFVQEALLKIISSLETFRGESRFLTWANKIAIHVAFTELRRRRWKDISLQTLLENPSGDDFTPSFLRDPNAAPESDIAEQELLRIVFEIIETELTDRQKTALLAVVRANIPLDELAIQMGTNRNALYKLIHDARQRLQQKLAERAGLTPGEILATFNRLP